MRRFSSSKEETRIKKMKAKLLLDDIGTSTGIHPLYRSLKEKVTGHKTLYHYTPTKNLESILKNGFDPSYDTVSGRWEKNHPGQKYTRGVYFGNQSKAVPRSTSIDRYKSLKRKISRGAEIPEGWGDPGVIMTLKIPMSEYRKMKKLERDPMVDVQKGGFKELMKYNPKFKEEYERSGFLEKLRTRIMAGTLEKHGKKDVVLLQEKIDPKYITKIDKDWS